jgi:hypothetical protein
MTSGAWSPEYLMSLVKDTVKPGFRSREEEEVGGIKNRRPIFLIGKFS